MNEKTNASVWSRARRRYDDWFKQQTKTRLAEPWRELCTVVGWVNSNPAVPLIASITYTNGVPVTTNWYQCYLDRSMVPTNVVVYGALPSFNLLNPQSRFYKLSANTNAISTSWP